MREQDLSYHFTWMNNAIAHIGHLCTVVADLKSILLVSTGAATVRSVEELPNVSIEVLLLVSSGAATVRSVAELPNVSIEVAAT
jgi:hypothetical protein